MKEEKRLLELGFELPDLTEAPTHQNIKLYGISHILPNRKVKDLLFTASVPTLAGKEHYKGTLGDTLTPEEGYKASQVAAVSALAGMKYALGSLDRIECIVRVFAFIICTPDFIELTHVGNGATDVFQHVLGNRGYHMRADVGMTGIAGGHSIELVMISKFRI
jgi:hypothetical protein